MRVFVMMVMMMLLVGVGVVVLGSGRSKGYRPVVIVHGIFDGPKQFRMLSRFIKQAHPGTEVVTLALYDYMSSLHPLWQQVGGFGRALTSIMSRSPAGVHLLCFSQGGLICRALLYTLPHHNVHSFISLSSPQAGQYGDTHYLRWLFPERLKRNVFHVCYNNFGQKISICNYWNDPHHRARYLARSSFLPLINAERHHALAQHWKENFLRIRKLVLIGGPDDDVITPWQSSHFGFYDGQENIVDMRNQDYYKEDGFGLKTLDDRGGVELCQYSGVKHGAWHSNYSVFTGCIKPWLT
ncbi:unnamed protein product [Gadus morhua 'NCC']